jgi:hypothetical protein
MSREKTTATTRTLAPWDTRRWSRNASALALIAAGALLAGCASGSTNQGAPNPEASAASARTPSAAVAEAGAATPRLVLTYDGGLLVADARNGEVVSDLALAGFNRVNPAGDGRRALVSTAGGFQVLDTGAWSEKHGDHSHHYTSTPALTDLIFPAQKPGHAVAHADHTALFDDGTGKISIFESAKLDNAALPNAEVVSSPEAHHGVAVQLSDGKLLTTEGNADSRNTIKLLSAPNAKDQRKTVAKNNQCPGVHGEATAKDETVVVGCEDGILIIKDEKISKVDAPDTYGRIGNQAGSEVSSVVLGDYKTEKDAELERPQTFSLTDTASNKLKLVDIDYSYSFRSLGRSLVGEALLLGTDGALHIYDEATGKETNNIPVVGAWEEPVDWQQPRPALHVSGNTAFVTEPATSQLHFVDLATGKVSNSVLLPKVPNEITSIKG